MGRPNVGVVHCLQLRKCDSNNSGDHIRKRATLLNSYQLTLLSDFGTTCNEVFGSALISAALLNPPNTNKQTNSQTNSQTNKRLVNPTTQLQRQETPTLSW
jgi:hypothetical protein